MEQPILPQKPPEPKQKRSCCCTSTALLLQAICWALIGGGLLALIYFGPIVMDDLIRQGVIKQRLVTGPDSIGYDEWISNQYEGASPEYFHVYLYHVTNVPEILNGGKPILQQVGPFVYEHLHHFFDVKFSDDKTTVDTKRFETYKFHPELSVGNPETTWVTVANIPYTAVKSKVDPEDEWWSALAFDLLASAAHADAFVNTTVSDYVFGYDAPFLNWIHTTVPNLKQKTWFELQHNFTDEAEGREFLNWTVDTYYTGIDDINKMATYKCWHNLTDLQVWQTQEANTLQGTDGSRFGVVLPDDKNLTIYIDTLYRHSPFWFNMTTDIKGITMRRYWLDPRAGFNESQGNVAYNLYAPYGINNMTAPEKVKEGVPVPVFLSLPYFFHADQFYLDQMTFLPPFHGHNEALHNTELDIEPYTGLTMSAKKRVQVNVKLEGSMLHNPLMKDYYFPVAWFSLESEISDQLADKFKSQVVLAVKVKQYIPYICGGVGGAMMLLVLVLLGLSYKNQKKRGTLYESIN